MNNDASSSRVLMVCLGNICRSPTAEAVFRTRLMQRGLLGQIDVDSAGTSDWHVGEAPDRRSIVAAARRDYDLSPLRGRQVADTDFSDFDYILAMDRANLRDLHARCPAEHAHKLQLFLRFGKQGVDEVPDPYQGGPDGFEYVLDLVEEACDGLLEEILKRQD